MAQIQKRPFVDHITLTVRSIPPAPRQVSAASQEPLAEVIRTMRDPPIAPDPRQVSGSQEPLVDQGIKVIKTMQGLSAQKDNPDYREAYELEQEILKLMQDNQNRNQAWDKYRNSKIAILSGLASNYTSDPRGQEMLLQDLQTLAEKVSQYFHNEYAFSRFTSTYYSIHMLNVNDKAGGVRDATLEELSKIILSPYFDPSMISKVEQIASRAKTNIILINKLRSFHRHIEKKVPMTKTVDTEMLGLAAIFGYMKKELEDFVTKKSDQPIGHFESSDALLEKLESVRDTISNIMSKL
jgi:hypothetical protein